VGEWALVYKYAKGLVEDYDETLAGLYGGGGEK